jgi:hypothetical protein
MVLRKMGSAIKRFSTGAYNAVKRGIQVTAPKLLQLGSAGLGILSKLPGTVGHVAGAVKAGADTLKNIVGSVPNQGVKDKLTNIIDKGTSFVDRGMDVVNRVSNAVNRN